MPMLMLSATWGMLRRLAPVVLALTLPGCESPQQIAAREAVELQARAAAALDRECRSWGVAPGTAGYVQCRAALLRAQTDAAIARQQAEAAAWGAWAMDMDAMKSPPPSLPRNCTSAPVGNTVQPNCY
jgi:hypothetical protein